jgi:hypothetical protein
MSFFDEASWVLIPEGIKEDVVYAQKPTDGLGDLTFTRASDATRTNSAGVIERTPWNLLQSSEMLGAAVWTPLDTTLTLNNVIAPNGTLTADTMTVTATTSSVRQTVSLNPGTYTASVYARVTSGNPTVRILLVIGGANTFQNFTITSEWQRYTFTVTAASTITNFQLRATSGTGEVAWWGAQVVEGTDAKPYFPTTNRQDVPRLDYRNADGTVNSCPRLLLEPQRTNSIRNSTMVGAVAGSPGTTPTNWDNASMAGLTRTVVGLGTENGLQYIDLRFNGTATSTVITIWFETVNQITASTGQTWTSSVYAKSISGSPLGYNITIREQDAAGATLRTGSQTITPTSTLQRFTYTRTNDGVGTAFIRPAVWATLTNGATYDFTIRIAAPQMELAGNASTFIPTTTAAVTRLADAAFKTGVADLIGQTEGTLFLEFVAQLTGANQSFSISNGTTSQRVDIRITANAFQTVGTFNGSSELNITGGTAVNGATYKMAVAYKTNDAALYVNGVQIGTDSLLGVVGTFNRIGFDVAAGTQPFNSPVVQAALFPTRLTNAQLVTLTT